MFAGSREKTNIRACVEDKWRQNKGQEKTAAEKKKREIMNDSDKRSLGVRACMHDRRKAKGITIEKEREREREREMKNVSVHAFMCVCVCVCVCVCHNVKKCQTNGKHDKRHRRYFK